MSRNTLYTDDRLIVIHGHDHMFGEFYQIYDKNLMDETPEQEGIIISWSDQFGYDTNLTGIPNKPNVLDVVNQYIQDNNVQTIND